MLGVKSEHFKLPQNLRVKIQIFYFVLKHAFTLNTAAKQSAPVKSTKLFSI